MANISSADSILPLSDGVYTCILAWVQRKKLSIEDTEDAIRGWARFDPVDDIELCHVSQLLSNSENKVIKAVEYEMFVRNKSILECYTQFDRSIADKNLSKDFVGESILARMETLEKEKEEEIRTINKWSFFDLRNGLVLNTLRTVFLKGSVEAISAFEEKSVKSWDIDVPQEQYLRGNTSDNDRYIRSLKYLFDDAYLGKTVPFGTRDLGGLLIFSAILTKLQISISKKACERENVQVHEESRHLFENEPNADQSSIDLNVNIPLDEVDETSYMELTTESRANSSLASESAQLQSTVEEIGEDSDLNSEYEQLSTILKDGSDRDESQESAVPIEESVVDSVQDGDESRSTSNAAPENKPENDQISEKQSSDVAELGSMSEKSDHGEIIDEDKLGDNVFKSLETNGSQKVSKVDPAETSCKSSGSPIENTADATLQAPENDVSKNQLQNGSQLVPNVGQVVQKCEPSGSSIGDFRRFPIDQTIAFGRAIIRDEYEKHLKNYKENSKGLTYSVAKKIAVKFVEKRQAALVKKCEEALKLEAAPFDMFEKAFNVGIPKNALPVYRAVVIGDAEKRKRVYSALLKVIDDIPSEIIWQLAMLNSMYKDLKFSFMENEFIKNSTTVLHVDLVKQQCESSGTQVKTSDDATPQVPKNDVAKNKLQNGSQKVPNVNPVVQPQESLGSSVKTAPEVTFRVPKVPVSQRLIQNESQIVPNVGQVVQNCEQSGSSIDDSRKVPIDQTIELGRAMILVEYEKHLKNYKENSKGLTYSVAKKIAVKFVEKRQAALVKKCEDALKLEAAPFDMFEKASNVEIPKNALPVYRDIVIGDAERRKRVYSALLEVIDGISSEIIWQLAMLNSMYKDLKFSYLENGFIKNAATNMLKTFKPKQD